MRVILVGKYKVSYPFSEHRLDYRMFKSWAEQLGQLDIIVQGSDRTALVWQDANLTVYYAPSLPVASDALTFVFWTIRKLLRLHQEAPIDIINGSDLWGSIIGISVRPFLGNKVLVQLQGEFLPPNHYYYSFPQRFLFYRMARFACRKADMVRCLYHSAAERVVALGVPRYRIAVVPSRCDVDLFNVERFPPKNNVKHPQLLYVGNLVPGKGVHFLLKALPNVVREYPDVELTIVGDGPQRLQLMRLADKLGLTSRVVFLGRLPHDEIPSIMHMSDLFVLPSLSEATPRVVMEAMAMELPVVATRVGGIPEIIEDGRTGVVVEPANPQQLAEAICRVLGDPVWAKEAGQLGRQRVLENYTLEQHIKRMVALHYQVVRQ